MLHPGQYRVLKIALASLPARSFQGSTHRLVVPGRIIPRVPVQWHFVKQVHHQVVLWPKDTFVRHQFDVSSVDDEAFLTVEAGCVRVGSECVETAREREMYE